MNNQNQPTASLHELIGTAISIQNQNTALHFNGRQLYNLVTQTMNCQLPDESSIHTWVLDNSIITGNLGNMQQKDYDLLTNLDEVYINNLREQIAMLDEYIPVTLPEQADQMSSIFTSKHGDILTMGIGDCSITITLFNSGRY